MREMQTAFRNCERPHPVTCIKNLMYRQIKTSPTIVTSLLLACLSAVPVAVYAGDRLVLTRGPVVSLPVGTHRGMARVLIPIPMEGGMLASTKKIRNGTESNTTRVGK